MVDVGFGNLTPMGLVAPSWTGCRAGDTAWTGAVVARRAQMVLQTRLGISGRICWRLKVPGTKPPDVDFDVANWFTATHPDSLFVNNIPIGRRAGADAERYTFLNGQVTELASRTAPWSVKH